MIAVKDLRLRYPKASEDTLHGLSFSVESGEVFGFLGPSGAGKSTTQHILTRLLRGYSGEITVLGKRLHHWGINYAARIGVGFEQPIHYGKLTARENLAFFAALYPQACLPLDGLLERVGLAEDASKPVQLFSKGMAMRLNFVRAVQHNPDLLFLDEPVAGLDPGNAVNLRKWIEELREEGKTIFLTTHDMTLADTLCDRVALIADGELRALDTPSRLKAAHARHEVEVHHKTPSATTDDLQIATFPLDSLGDNSAFLELLRGSSIHRLHTPEPTLETVFLNLTGQQLQ